MSPAPSLAPSLAARSQRPRAWIVALALLTVAGASGIASLLVRKGLGGAKVLTSVGGQRGFRGAGRSGSCAGVAIRTLERLSLSKEARRGAARVRAVVYQARKAAAAYIGRLRCERPEIAPERLEFARDLRPLARDLFSFAVANLAARRRIISLPLARDPGKSLRR